MKQHLMLALCLAATAAQAAEPSAACAAKRSRIEAEISEANAQGQRHKLAGLQKALRNNAAHCTDASLARDRERDIAKATREVKEREADLKKAQRKGDADKIAQRQHKLDEARAELTAAQRPVPDR